MSNKIANSILSAIDIVVDKKISEASFDRTVIATVVKPISNMANNKYQVRYQDSLLEALVPNDAVYRAGDSVFLLMPQNKLEEQNWILGTALSSRVSETKEELINANYTIISTITGNTEDIFSATANMARKEIILWSADGQYNKISIDADAFASNAKRADTILISAEF